MSHLLLLSLSRLLLFLVSRLLFLLVALTTTPLFVLIVCPRCICRFSFSCLLFLFIMLATPFLCVLFFLFVFVTSGLFAFTVAFHLCACYCSPLLTSYFSSLHLLLFLVFAFAMTPSLQWLLFFVFVLLVAPFFMLAIFPLCTCCCSLFRVKCFSSSHLLHLPSSCLLLPFSSYLLLFIFACAWC